MEYGNKVSSGFSMAVLTIAVILYCGGSVGSAARIDGQFPVYESSEPHDNRTVINVLGLIPVSGKAWPAGESVITSMELAFRHINDRPDVLPGYRIRMLFADSMCKAGVGVNALYRKLYAPPVKHIIYSGGCSSVCQPVTLAANIWNLTVVSGSCSSPLLNNRALYPNIFRNTQSDTRNMVAVVRMADYFNWRKLGFISESQSSFASTSDNMMEMIKEFNMSVITNEIFHVDPSLQVANLKKHDVRIIIGMFYEDRAADVMCEAFKNGLYGDRHIWFLPGWYGKHWWKTNKRGCTVDQLLKVIQGSLAVTFSQEQIELRGENTISGFSYRQFLNLFDEKTDHSRPLGSQLATLFYDASWIMALSLNYTRDQLWRKYGSTKTLEDFTYADGEIYSLMKESFSEMHFRGLTGSTYFTKFGGATRPVTIIQFIGNSTEIRGVHVEGNQNINESLTFTNGGIYFSGGFIPRDSSIITLKRVYIDTNVYSILSCIAIVGVVFSVILLMFNFVYRNMRTIRMSSPRINNIILIGCVLSYSTILFNEIKGAPVLPFCMVRLFTYNVGFCLTFGAMLAKTWRVHKVLIEAKKKMSSIVIKDVHLMMIILVVVVFDVVLLSLQQVYNQMEAKLVNGTTTNLNNDADLVVQHQTMVCSIQGTNYLGLSLTAWHALMLVFGAFIAWETRTVKVEALNDSKQIAICIYNISVLVILENVITYLLSENTEGVFLFSSLFVIASTFLTQLILFMPKVHKVMTGGGDVDPIIPEKSSMEVSKVDRF